MRAVREHEAQLDAARQELARLVVQHEEAARRASEAVDASQQSASDEWQRVSFHFPGAGDGLRRHLSQSLTLTFKEACPCGRVSVTQAGDLTF